MLIAESRDGVTVTSTRQNAGTSLYGDSPPRPARSPGEVNCPAATVCARTNFASGSESDVRPSHELDVCGAPVAAAIAITIHTMSGRISTQAPSGIKRVLRNDRRSPANVLYTATAGAACACGFLARNSVASATIDIAAAAKKAHRYSPVAT